MKQPKRKRTTLPSGLAGSYDEADGKDPRFDPSPALEAGVAGKGDRRKLMQLCSQVLKTLQLVWPSGGDILDWTGPAEVLPAPNSHNLLIIIHCNQSPELLPDPIILDAIQQRSDDLRQEVARAISRKRTPRLSFAIMPRIEGSTRTG